MKKIKITYKNKVYEVQPFSTPLDFLAEHKMSVHLPVAAVINGHLTRLNKQIPVDSAIDFVDQNTYQGRRIFESSILFLYLVAFAKKFPENNVFIQHSLHNAVFTEVKDKVLTPEEIKSIEDKMNELVEKDLPISRISQDWDVSLSKMADLARQDLINLFKYYSPTQLKLYSLDGVEEVLYLPLVPSTKYLKGSYKLSSFQDGTVVQFLKQNETQTTITLETQRKVFNTFKEYHYWSRILKIRTVGQLNRYIMNDDIGSLVNVTEALHEKKVVKIADEICSREFIPKVVLIAGPSSSGKTTFSKRLDVQLRVNGLRPLAISLDDYFLERDKTPKDADGNYDFENLRAIDVPLFSQDLKNILDGAEVEIPTFDFRSGQRVYKGHKIKLAPDQIIIIEGIHGLNPKLTENIENKFKFKIYVSALTQLNLHRHDRVPTSDTRLIRRIVRDSNFRGYSASNTLLQWNKVREGEKVNIFPYQEEADVIFNSALFYELSILKIHAERELLRVERQHPMFAEAQRLLTFLSFFLPLDPLNIPKNSILREFIGGSAFKY